MAKPGPKKGEGGRPKISDPDWDEVEKMMVVQNTEEDIAYILGMSSDTLARKVKEKYGITFAELYQQKKRYGKDKIRKLMWNAAQKGSIPMLIWLSKNWLGMRDNPEEIFEQKPTIIKTRDGVEIKLGFNKDKGKSDDSD
jgi:hypothetical protein